MTKLTKAQGEALDHAWWCERSMGWKLVSCRAYLARTVRQLVGMGLLRSAGDVVMCDDDGDMGESERYREGFELTDEGRKIAEKREDESRHKDVDGFMRLGALPEVAPALHAERVVGAK